MSKKLNWTQEGKSVMTLDMSSPKPSSRPVLAPEIEAEMTPAVKAFVETLIDHYEARITELKSKIQKLTPRNFTIAPPRSGD